MEGEELREGLREAIRVLEDDQEYDEHRDAIEILERRLDATYPGG